MSLLRRSNLIKNKAQNLLDDSNFINIVTHYGNIDFIGSYATNLMTWNDIDILISADSNLTLSEFCSIAAKLSENNSKLCKIDIRNFTEIKNTTACNQSWQKYHSLPYGLYIGFEYIIDNELWKIDLWQYQDLEQKKKILDFQNFMIKAINNEQAIRNLILEIKFFLKENNPNNRIITGDSYKLYQAVFLKEMRDKDKILEYLTN